MKTGRYNMAQLLTNSGVEQIIIPEIQRDYVWTEENVGKLLKSILHNYKKKANLSLDIKCGGETLPEDIRHHLAEEYQRIRFGTNIGFLYAYYDPTYAGRLFLIDGQQRLTTLMLVLLAAYCDRTKDSELKHEYKTKYFVDELPKLDYKVREVTHDFMVAFVNHITSDSEIDFKNSVGFYDIFDKDKTTTRMLGNYHVITKTLRDSGVYNNRREFIDYIENYVEFNYFDTNLSEQGEKLYLYMNSRGEELSEQENVKAMLISRSTNKLDDSRKWEDWQNFFWNERGENKNADQEFKLFLQRSAAIHLCVKQQLTRNEKENILKGLLQSNEVRHYLQTNTDIDVAWLEKVFDATKKFASFNAVADGYLRKKWLAIKQEDDLYMIDYVPILGCIYYMTQYPDATELDVKRLGMHLKNICFYDTNSKNPDSAVIISLESIREMCKQKIMDIADAPTSLDERFYSASDKRKAELYHTQERSQWEKMFWETINYDNNEFNSFIKGNTAILLDLCDGNISFENYRKAKEIFCHKVYEIHEKPELRRNMLKHGDFSWKEGGSASLGTWMDRRNLIPDKEHWYELLNNKPEPGFSILKDYLYDRNSSAVRLPEGINVFADPQYGCLEYMSQYKFLRSDTNSLPHIVLLKRLQASKNNSRELPVQMLHKRITNSWVREHNICVVEFYFKGETLHIGKKDDKNLYFYIVYEHNDDSPSWRLYIGSRRGKLDSSVTDKLKQVTHRDWRYLSDDGKCYIEKFCTSQDSSFVAVVDSVLKEFEEIKALLPYNLGWEDIENTQ